MIYLEIVHFCGHPASFKFSKFQDFENFELSPVDEWRTDFYTKTFVPYFSEEKASTTSYLQEKLKH